MKSGVPKERQDLTPAARAEEAVKEFAHFLIDNAQGGEIHISDLPDLVVEFLEGHNG